jgi:hypothetical protein
MRYFSICTSYYSDDAAFFLKTGFTNIFGANQMTNLFEQAIEKDDLVEFALGELIRKRGGLKR